MPVSLILIVNSSSFYFFMMDVPAGPRKGWHKDSLFIFLTLNIIVVMLLNKELW